MWLIEYNICPFYIIYMIFTDVVDHKITYNYYLKRIVLLPQEYVTLAEFNYHVQTLWCIAPNYLKLLDFSIICLWACLMKVIPYAHSIRIKLDINVFKNNIITVFLIYSLEQPIQECLSSLFSNTKRLD
jgi:hypothetical protein